MNFQKLKETVRKNFDKLAGQNDVLFYVSIDREKIFEEYLAGFSEDIRQEYNCNSCKSFLRQWGGIVAIINNQVVSIWDNIDLEGYEEVAKRLSNYIHSLPITNVFYNEFAKCGTDFNIVLKDSDGNPLDIPIRWNHLYIQLPNRMVVKNNIDVKRNEKRTNKSVLQRSLNELTIDATETILELIAQNSLYKGKESEGILNEFLKLQEEYRNIPDKQKDNFCWLKSTEISTALSRIRNTAIGTLLINLSENMDLETAVKKFETVVAPANYQRPVALVNPKMIEKAKKELKELGLINSLERRFATEADVNINDILFNNADFKLDNDIFEEVAKTAVVNPKTFGKMEEININDFIEKVLPHSQSIELFLENSHLSNMVSLITAKNSDAPSLFRWNNPFSWSYTGNVTDSMKERVKAAGGKVDGVLRFSIQWNECGNDPRIDLDAHAREPNGKHIYFSTHKGYPTPMTGILDVDMN